MIFSSWKAWLFSETGAFQIALQLLFTMVLALTPTRLISSVKLSSWLNREPIALVGLSITALLLTLATGHPLGAGAICLLLDGWWKRNVVVSHPLDAAFSVWAITLGILLGESQYVIAFMGTIIPSLALWIYTTFTPSISESGYLLIRLSLPTKEQSPHALFRSVQAHFAHPLHQVYQHEHQDGVTYGLAIPSQSGDLQRISENLHAALPPDVQLELQPVTQTAAMLGRWA